MPPSDRSILHLLRDFTRHVSSRRRKQFFLLLLLMLIGAVAELVTIGAVVPFITMMANPEAAFRFPWLQQLFTRLGWTRPEDIVLPMTMLFLVIVALSTSIRLLLLWVSNRYVFALGYDIGVSLYKRVISQPYQYHISRNTSTIIAAIDKVQAVLNGAVKPVLEGGIALVLALAIVGALLWIDFGATLGAAMVFISLYLAIAGFTRVRLRANGKQIASARTERVRYVQEGLGGIRDVLLDQSQPFYTGIFAKADGRLRTAQARNAFLNQAPRYLIEAVGVFLIIGLAWFLSVQTGGLMAALPVLGALALGAQRLLPLLQKIYGAWAKMTGNQQMFVDVLELLDLPVNEIDPKSKIPRLPFEREIRLDGIGFRYPRSHETVLESINLSISKGSRIGIVGPTGSGKSTLVDLIMGLLEPTDGKLTVDGVLIHAGNRRAWQQCISHVPQHIFLADASIAQNIAIGVPEKKIDMDRVRYAARCAQIADFIEANPQGYQASVGERGIQLSGGQRQRIGIARAIYRNADVIVLDEATSALDTDTENAVMHSLNMLDEDLTVFLIAHRVQTLRDCDLILKLDSGRLVVSGNYVHAFGDNVSHVRIELSR